MNVFGLNDKQRQYVYGIIIALIPILVSLKAITPDQVHQYLNLAAQILGFGAAGTAGVALTRQRKDGILP